MELQGLVGIRFWGSRSSRFLRPKFPKGCRKALGRRSIIGTVALVCFLVATILLAIVLRFVVILLLTIFLAEG